MSSVVSVGFLSQFRREDLYMPLVVFIFQLHAQLITHMFVNLGTQSFTSFEGLAVASCLINLIY
jgi:hypothetical protein